MKRILTLTLLLYALFARSQTGTFTDVRVRDSLTSFTNNTDLILKGLGTGGVNIEGEYTLPLTDGTVNQVFQTDGAGNIVFTDLPSGYTVTNEADNRVVTSTGAGTGNAETNLQFTGTQLNVIQGTGAYGINLSYHGAPRFQFTADSDGTSGGPHTAQILVDADGDSMVVTGMPLSISNNPIYAEGGIFNGITSITHANGRPLLVNRTGTDGQLITAQNDGITVFNLQATGDLTLAGSLSATEGTFSNALTAASSNFNQHLRLARGTNQWGVSPSTDGAINTLDVTFGYATDRKIRIRNASTVLEALGDVSITGSLTAGAITGTTGTFSGDLIINQSILNDSNEGVTLISGDIATASGANLALFAGGHPTTANDIRFRANAANVLYYDHSASNWNFQGGSLTAGAISGTSGLFSGNIGSNKGSDWVLYGDNNSILFRPVGQGSATNQVTFPITGGPTFAALAGTGDRLVKVSSTGQESAIANGTDGQVMTMVGTTPAWANTTEITVQRTLTSTEILNSNTTPIEIVAAPGAGKTIVMLRGAQKFLFNATPYATNTNSQMHYDNGLVAITSAVVNISDGSSYFTHLFPTTNKLTSTSTENKNVTWQVNSGNPTAGDSEIKISFTYVIIDNP